MLRKALQLLKKIYITISFSILLCKSDFFFALPVRCRCFCFCSHLGVCVFSFILQSLFIFIISPVAVYSKTVYDVNKTASPPCYMCYSWNFYKIDSFLKPVLNIIVFCKIIVGGGGGGEIIKNGGWYLASNI